MRREAEKRIFELTEEKDIIFDKKRRIEQAETDLRIQNKALSVTLGQFQNEEAAKLEITHLIRRTLQIGDKLAHLLRQKHLFIDHLGELEQLPRGRALTEC